MKLLSSWGGLLGATAASCAIACSGQGAKPAAPPVPRAVIPKEASALSPAHVVARGTGNTGDVVTEVESCASCHADAAAQWRTSAHAFASFNNPIYRVAVDRFRNEVGREQSRFCAGCHDVALLVDGAMSREVEASDPRAHGGVTCRVCHGIAETRPDGNGSYTLASAEVPIPRDGDPESLRLHKARTALAPLRTAALCGSCHRAFLSPLTGNAAHLVGQDELGQWSQSAYAGSLANRVDEALPEKECRTCHMPQEAAPLGDAAAKEGRIASHRFMGAHTWLAAMRGDAGQRERLRARLQNVASIDVPEDGAEVHPGESMVLDVVVRNLGVGHRFPAGTMDAQDTWIELTVSDARGHLLAEAGTEQEATGDDPTAHRLRAVQAGDDGHPLLERQTHRFRTPVYNHTIPARDGEVVRYRFDVPEDLPARALPLQVKARLRHRSRNLALQKAACEDSRTPRGQAFAAAVKHWTSGPIDPCIMQPVTDIAAREVWLGKGWEARTQPSEVPAWRRDYDHALGLLHALQEEAGTARPSLERALSEVGADTRGRTMVMALAAQIAARQGRTEEALGWLDRAGAILPDHPALAHIRGEALGGVWRWKEAAGPLRAAALASPHDDQAWMHLAVAAGSAGDPAGALEAAQRALLLQPRDQDCLRVQALSLEALGAPDEDVQRAEQAFADFRNPDDAPGIRAKCSKDVFNCALERVPVHTHEMRAASPVMARKRAATSR